MGEPRVPFPLQHIEAWALNTSVYGQLMSVAQCATYLNLSVERVQELVRLEAIPHCWVDGTGPYCRPAEVRAWARKALVHCVTAQPLPIHYTVLVRERPVGPIPLALEPMRERLCCNLPLDAKAVGVYFLIREASVVYVGQTVNLLARLGQHATAKAGQFDAVLWMPCPEESLLAVERWWITHLHPSLNTVEWEHDSRWKAGAAPVAYIHA